MITYLGSLTIGATIPAAVFAVEAVLPNLQAQIAALAAFTATITPPSFQADLALAGEIVANLQASIALGITPPTISAQLSIVAALLAVLEAQLSVILAIPFGVAGVHAYHIAANANAIGGEITTQLAGGFPAGGPTDPSNALLLATTIGATWTAMQQVFKTTP
jgi:hypothetical protein